MRKRYDLIMEHITVTDDMRDRILDTLQKTGPASGKKAVRFPLYRKYLSVAACFVLLLAAFALPHLLRQPVEPPPVQVVPDIASCASAGELSEMVGFPIPEVKALPFEAKEVSYTAFWKQLGQVQYRGDTQSAVFRMSQGSEDNSGDYNTYDTVGAVTVQNRPVTLKGNAGSFSLALWSDGEYAYSLRLTFGMPEPEWNELIASIG